MYVREVLLTNTRQGVEFFSPRVWQSGSTSSYRIRATGTVSALQPPSSQPFKKLVGLLKLSFTQLPTTHLHSIFYLTSSVSHNLFLHSHCHGLLNTHPLSLSLKKLSLFQMRQLDQHSPLTRPQHPDKRGEKKLRGKIQKKKKGREREGTTAAAVPRKCHARTCHRSPVLTINVPFGSSATLPCSCHPFSRYSFLKHFLEAFTKYQKFLSNTSVSKSSDFCSSCRTDSIFGSVPLLHNEHIEKTLIGESFTSCAF